MPPNSIITHKNDTVTQGGGVHGLKVESGEWTPTLNGLTGNIELSNCWYVRNANIAIVSAEIKIISIDSADNFYIRIIGFPFVRQKIAFGAFILENYDNSAYKSVHGFMTESGSMYFVPRFIKLDGNMTTRATNTLLEGTVIRIQVSYLI